MERRLTLRGLFSGMAIAIVLVFLLLVIYFKSVIDPLIVLMAVLFALSGAMWMLFITQTHISVPALMGTIISMALGGAFFLRHQLRFRRGAPPAWWARCLAARIRTPQTW